eukprot:11858239-Alexandrium_andersonii.AAC.1
MDAVDPAPVDAGAAPPPGAYVDLAAAPPVDAGAAAVPADAAAAPPPGAYVDPALAVAQAVAQA